MRALLALCLLTGCSESAHLPLQGAGDASAAAVPLRYLRILSAGVHAQDPARARAWYGDVLGLSPLTEGRFFLGDLSSVEVLPGGVAAPDAKAPEAQSTVMGLGVPDLAAGMALLESRGVAFLGPVGTDLTDSWVYVADPEGNQLEITQIGARRPGTAIEGLPWSGVYVEAFEPMVAWYSNVLGLSSDGVGGGSKQWAHFQLDGGGYLELFSGGHAGTGPKTPREQPTVIGLEVPSLDRAIAELRSRGAAVGDGIVEWTSSTWPDERSTSVVDPEGNTLSIREISR